MRYPKLFYFFSFAALASLLPFLTLYYEQFGLNGRQIGVLVAIPPLVALVSAPLFGAIADATGRHKLMLVLAVCGFAGGVLVLSAVEQYVWLVAAVFGYAIFFAPVLPLVDKTVLDLLGNNKNQYGRQRFWGSVGWGVAGPVSGYLVGLTGLRAAFYVSFVFLLVCVGIAARLPVRRVSLSGHFGPGLRLLVTSWRWAVFLTVMFIAGAALAISFNYLFLYLAELQASSTWMGLSLTLATLSEMVVMFYAAQLLTRWGTRTLLMASLLFMALRLLGYAATASAAVVIALQLLHGPSFGLMWVAAVARADQLAPPGMSATAQGLNSGVTMGLGAAFGSIAGGFLYQSLGLALMFGWAGAAALAALILFVVAGRVAAQQKLKATAGEA